jgi:hypothetical protein
MKKGEPDVISIADRYSNECSGEARITFYDRDPLTQAKDHAVRALALLDCISTGELLSSLPKDEVARASHKNAVTLLDIMRDEVSTVLDCFTRLGVSED